MICAFWDNVSFLLTTLNGDHCIGLFMEDLKDEITKKRLYLAKKKIISLKQFTVP